MNGTWARGAAVLAALALIGCDAGPIDELLPEVQINGKLNITGPEPADYTFNIYPASDALLDSAFDLDYCNDYTGNDTCYGRVKKSELGQPADYDKVEYENKQFTISGIDADLGYFLEIEANDPNVSCTTDFIGFDEETRVATSGSAIAFSLDEDIDTFELPRNATLACVDLTEEPETPEREPVEEPEDPEAVDDDGDIAEPPPAAVVDWTSFVVTEKSGSIIYADASAGSVAADVACDDSFPAVFEFEGAVENAGEEAYIRIQYGTGDEAIFETIATPVVDGMVDQALSLTGGYAIVQLDTNADLDGEGESHTVTFCEPADEPVQEFYIQVTWDKDDTDIDVHVIHEDGTEVAYYNMSDWWGDLDIDDTDGYGPEVVTSLPGVLDGSKYAVRIHHYSDHGNGPVTVTARTVYYDAANDRSCDATNSRTLASGEWWETGLFGPTDCPPIGRTR